MRESCSLFQSSGYQKLLANFYGDLSVWDLSPPLRLCADLCRLLVLKLRRQVHQEKTRARKN